MTMKPLAEFRRALSDATRLSSYLKERFPSDRNFSEFDALVEFVQGHRNDLPSDIIVDGRDTHFVALMERAKLVQSAGGDRIMEIGPELDFLERTCRPDRLSALQILSFAVQCQRVPRKRLAVVLTARDEGIYLPEWLSHYRLIGAEQIFVYTNDNSDGSDKLLEQLAAAGWITLIKNRIAKGVNPQRKAYQHAILLLHELRDYKWALFIDADEFLNFHTDDTGSALKFIDKVEERFASDLPGGVVFPWNWRFTDRAFTRDMVNMLGYYSHASMHDTVKSMINVRRTLAMCEVHIPTQDEDSFFIDAEMRRVAVPGVWEARAYSGPVIEHFWSKSFAEFIIKKRRGDQLGLAEKLFSREFSHFFAWTGVPADGNRAPISRNWIRKVQTGASELLSDPVMAEAHQIIVEHYRRHVAEVSRNADLRQTYVDLLQSTAPTMF